jgi:predicted DNA-binding transcriptional regulator YafY
MRADRLISLLMLLQSHGRMSARELGEQLEVSERTIYRDIEALSGVGIPVYSETGRDGGFALLDHYRTSLTGLTESEVQALFMLSVPAALADLGVSQELKQAWLKLSAALPTGRRAAEKEVRQRFFLDSSWWNQEGGSVPHLETLYQAVWDDQRISLVYRPMPPVEIEQQVDPYGLVAKAGIWHLVCSRNKRLRVHQVSNLIKVSSLDETFERPEGFDLESFWKEWCKERQQRRTVFPVSLKVDKGMLPFLPMFFGEGINKKILQTGVSSEEGHMILELSFESLEAARTRLLALGAGVEILSPRALRESILDYGSQIVRLYSGN